MAAMIAALVVGCSYVGGQRTPDITAEPATPVPTVSQRPTPDTTTFEAGFVPEAEANQLIARCGISGDVAAYFRIPEGNDYRDHFPEMGLSPELDGVSGAFVVVYDGPVQGLFLGAPGASSGPVVDALCVISPDGYPNIYSDVSRDKMSLPAGAWVRSDPSPPQPTPRSSAGGSISVEVAIELARAHVFGRDVATIWGWESGSFRSVYASLVGNDAQIFGIAPRREVWGVSFMAPKTVCDQSGNGGCVTGTEISTQFLDYNTGEWLMGAGRGPYQPDELPTPMFGTDPMVDPLALSISNQTTLSVTLEINGDSVGSFGPGTHEDPLDPSHLPAPPWHVEAATSSGRVLVTMDVAPGDVWHTNPDLNGHSELHGAAVRADLSCGRLDIWSGPPLLGPPPPSSFPPGDCEI
jgi:hypothetical protein